MPKFSKFFTLFLTTVFSIVLAQLGDYTVKDYFLTMPRESLYRAFTPIIELGEFPAKTLLSCALVDTKNGYISMDIHEAQLSGDWCSKKNNSVDVRNNQLAEVVVWKAKNGKDRIAVSRRANFQHPYFSVDEEYAFLSLDAKLGVHQILDISRYADGKLYDDMDFLPSAKTINAHASKKYPELLAQKKSWRFAYILPRTGTTIRLVLYIVSKVNKQNKVLIKDVYKVLWDGYNFKSQPV